MSTLHINNSDEVIDLANKLSSEGRIHELRELFKDINEEINRFPLDERSKDNQLSLLKSKYEVESLIKRHIVFKSEKSEKSAKDGTLNEDARIVKLLTNKDNFFIICVIVSVLSAIGFFKFGWNFLFAFIPLIFFKKWKK
ncbi:MAG: hypothetical protein P8J38_01705 [Thermodesulfobacteriota bacteirum]|nr:hypothetical protein [Thermodesulfobacteriota bacterium]